MASHLTMTLKITYQGTDTIVPDGETAVIGADPEATVRIARPGISRRHLLVVADGGTWVAEDRASKNGTYQAGVRVQRLEISAPTTLWLGHPSEGEPVTLTPLDREATRIIPSGGEGTAPPPRPTTTPAPSRPAATARAAAPRRTRPAAPATDPRLDELVATLADTVKAVRGLTFSVWAMIAVTAVLALLTLFVGVLGRG